MESCYYSKCLTLGNGRETQRDKDKGSIWTKRTIRRNKISVGLRVTVISNATPLIYLAKSGSLKLLKKLFDSILIPKEVYEEVVVKGKEEGFSDALVVEEQIEKGWISIEDLGSDEKLVEHATELDKGETAVIKLAREKDGPLLLIDDAAGRQIAKSFGLEVKGTLYVILRAYKEGYLTKDQSRDILDEIISAGFRISSEQYSYLLRRLEMH